jgi:streptomycin 6-kinase
VTAPRPVGVPAGLGWWRSQPGGAEWLGRLPRLVAECCAGWDLALGAPFEPATISYVAPVTRADGAPAVLKVNFPEPESEHEAAALAHWDGAGAVRLLASDPARRALLVERCAPGDRLWGVADEARADLQAAAVLRGLWSAPPPPAGRPFRTLAGEARRWADELPARWERHRRPFDRALLDRAVGWIGELLATPDDAQSGAPVLLHQDLHGGNVLRAARGPWLAIDPKPLVGDRAFDLASLLRDRRPELAADPHPARRIRRRVDRLSEALDVDRERMRRWAVVHALAWGMGDDEWFAAIVTCAEWLARA